MGSILTSLDEQACRKSTQPVLLLVVRPHPVWKRCLDVLGALFGLVLCAPLFILIALVITWVSPGPVFYTQPRTGYGGRTFLCWKFRTMAVNADDALHRQHVQRVIQSSFTAGAEKPTAKLELGGDPRIIPFGSILRRSCLDELPQLLNVLRGEMSLVGPRPDPVYGAQQYSTWHSERLDVLPGMTGLWQVSGKNRTTFNEMVRLDLRYARQCSFGLDIKILFLTIPVLLKQVFGTESETVAQLPQLPPAEGGIEKRSENDARL